MRTTTFFTLLGAMLTACPEAAPPPAEKPTPSHAEPVDAGAEPKDAGLPPAPLPEELDGAPSTGISDDVQLDTDDLRDSAVQRLLLRDPDRAIRVLEKAPAPSAFLVAVLANLAVRRHVEGPPSQSKETPLPPVPASGTSASQPGPAFVGVELAELRAKNGKGKPLAVLPTGTALTIDSVQGALAIVSVALATKVELPASGVVPVHVDTKVLTGSIPLEQLVVDKPTLSALLTEARAQPDTEAGADTALILFHRALRLAPSESVRASMLAAAWRARRPSWVAATALEPVWATPRSIRAAYACRGNRSTAKWLPLGPKPPADVCLTGIDLHHACEGAVPAAITKKREQLTALGFPEPAPVIEVVVDATRARSLWIVSMPVRPTDECEERDEHKIDLFGAVIRRVPLPLGTAATTVSFPVSGWHGFEHSVVGAQSEAKARDWLRARRSSKWTYDAKGEPAPSLGVHNLDFHSERDVAVVSFGRVPQLECELCGGSDFR